MIELQITQLSTITVTLSAISALLLLICVLACIYCREKSPEKQDALEEAPAKLVSKRYQSDGYAIVEPTQPCECLQDTKHQCDLHREELNSLHIEMDQSVTEYTTPTSIRAYETVDVSKQTPNHTSSDQQSINQQTANHVLTKAMSPPQSPTVYQPSSPTSIMESVRNRGRMPLPQEVSSDVNEDSGIKQEQRDEYAKNHQT